MRRLAAFVARMLPLDDVGRRAMDETQADWDYEADLATSTAARARVAASGLSAAASVVVRSAFVDLRRPHTYGIGIATIGLSLVLGLAIVTLQTRAFLEWPEYVSAAQSVLLILFLLPSAVAITLPLATMTPPLARGRLGASSLVGLALILMLVAAVNVGWITPKANQAFRESTASILIAETGDNWIVGEKGLAESTVPELIASGRSAERSHPRLVRTLNTRASLVLLVPVCVLLGAQARRLSRAPGWRARGGLAAFGAATAIWGSAVAGGNAIYRLILRQPGLPSETLLVLQPWVMPAAFAVSAMLLAWLASRHEHHHAEPAMGAR